MECKLEVMSSWSPILALVDFLEAEKYCDVAEGRKIWAHKVILASQSEYFDG